MKLRYLPALFFWFCSILLTNHSYANDRVALVIGISDYSSITSLRNARRDAEGISDKLDALGFEVTEVFDADARSTNRAIERFSSKLSTTDIALVYFAGHGVQLFGENFLLASDFNPENITEESDLGIQLSKFITTLREAKAKRLIFIIDACRDNPFDAKTQTEVLKKASRTMGITNTQVAVSKGIKVGLAPIDASIAAKNPSKFDGETLFAFSAQPGKVALDGDGQNSPFANALISQMGNSNLNVVDTFLEVSRQVTESTNGFQRPELRMSWSTREIYLSKTEQDNQFASYLYYDTPPSTLHGKPTSQLMKQFLKIGYLSGSFNGVTSLHSNLGTYIRV